MDCLRKYKNFLCETVTDITRSTKNMFKNQKAGTSDLSLFLNIQYVIKNHPALGDKYCKIIS